MLPYIRTRVRNADLFEVALGKQQSDKVILNGKIVGVTSGEIFGADVAIKGERIALIGDVRKTIGSQTEVIDAKNLFLCPGFMDSHVHVESSLLLPEEYARIVITRGTTTIFFDPHEIAYVLGIKGIQFMLERGKKSCIKMFGHITPKLPHLISGGLETYGTEFSESDILKMFDSENIVSLGEQTFTKFLRSKRFFKIIDKAKSEGLFIEGSAHSLIGERLNAFIAAGIQSDHEATSKIEAEERLRFGIRLMMREGSTERNLGEILKAITETHLDSRHACFCTDDKTAEDLVEEGHIDHCIRKSIQLGLPPIKAYQIASVNTAAYYGLDKELGSISPGKIADIVFVDNLEMCNVRHVMSNGDIIVADGTFKKELATAPVPEWVLHTVRLNRRLNPEDFKILTDRGAGKVLCKVVQMIPNEITTEPTQEWLDVKGKEILQDPKSGICKLATVERYGKTKGPNIGLGFVKGFEMEHGALGISVAHDTHNIVLLGTNDVDMATVSNEIAKMGGGLAGSKNGEIICRLPLEVAGLLSSLPAEKLIDKLRTVHRSVRDFMKVKIHSPFIAISFLASSGIPKLKVSDKGLVDTVKGEIVSILA